MENSTLIPVVKWIRNGFASEEQKIQNLEVQAPPKQGKKDPNFDLEGYDEEDSKINRHACICSRGTKNEL